MKTEKRCIIFLTIAFSLVLYGCFANNIVKGGVIGGVGGVLVGGVIGHYAGDPELGAIMGVAALSTAGALIGNDMDERIDGPKPEIRNFSWLWSKGSRICISHPFPVYGANASMNKSPTAVSISGFTIMLLTNPIEPDRLPDCAKKINTIISDQQVSQRRVNPE
jgi:hypothetical protein